MTRIAGLTFNAKINPMIPFAIKGVVWYQGEENHGMGMRYSDYLTCMARAWRKEWGSDLPFLIVMLAPHTYEGVPEQFPGGEGEAPRILDGAARCRQAAQKRRDRLHPGRGERQE